MFSILYYLSLVCGCALVEVKRCMVEFEVGEFGGVSWCSTLFVVGWSDVIGIVCSSVRSTMSMRTHHLGGGWIARGHHHGLMLPFAGDCRASSLSNRISIMCIRGVVDGLVPPVPGV